VVANTRLDAQRTRSAVNAHRSTVRTAASAQRDELQDALGNRASVSKAEEERRRATTVERLALERQRLAVIDAKREQLAAERRARKEADEVKVMEVRGHAACCLRSNIDLTARALAYCLVVLFVYIASFRGLSTRTAKCPPLISLPC
jgi:hypothetical protein